jgi:hypothetical protein
LEGLTNPSVECEETKNNMQEVGSQLQTSRLKLIFMQQTLKNCEKELANVKGQLAKV